jgi:hypothetical protein
MATRDAVGQGAASPSVIALTAQERGELERLAPLITAWSARAATNGSTRLSESSAAHHRARRMWTMTARNTRSAHTNASWSPPLSPHLLGHLCDVAGHR